MFGNYVAGGDEFIESEDGELHRLAVRTEKKVFAKSRYDVNKKQCQWWRKGQHRQRVFSLRVHRPHWSLRNLRLRRGVLEIVQSSRGLVLSTRGFALPAPAGPSRRLAWFACPIRVSPLMEFVRTLCAFLGCRVPPSVCTHTLLSHAHFLCVAYRYHAHAWLKDRVS